MVAATVTEIIETFDPIVEEVVLEVSDGETYRARKLAQVKTAHLTNNTNTDGNTNVTISGQEVTMNMAGVTNDAVTLTLRGRN